MEKIFENKVAIVTGAAGGIGRAAAIAFAQRGAKVVVADINDGSETISLIKKTGGDGFFVKCDVSKDEDVKAMVDKTVSTYGRIDFAYNNAGIEGTTAMIQDTSSADWNRTLDINLKGVFHCMKYEIPQMLKQGKGAIVNCASVAGLVGFAGISPYVASKHAIVGITKAVALENAKTGIRVNAVCPGVIQTEMIDRFIKTNPQAEQMLTAGEPVGRLGKPEEIAEAVIWLCSDAASFVTGLAMPVDGGWVAQ
jgi:NAD(P)-dependent dehydrogenase (short-subunit alcohol dehydrogenase family)